MSHSAVYLWRLLRRWMNWIGGDNVPFVEKVGEVAGTAESEVDYAVGAADAAFHPDWEGALVCVELG